MKSKPLRQNPTHPNTNQLPQNPRPLPRQLPRTDQHPNEREAGADGRRARPAHGPGHYRAAHEHHHGAVGHERVGAGPGLGGRSHVVRGHHGGAAVLWAGVLLGGQEGVWDCVRFGYCLLLFRFRGMAWRLERAASFFWIRFDSRVCIIASGWGDMETRRGGRTMCENGVWGLLRATLFFSWGPVEAEWEQGHRSCAGRGGRSTCFTDNVSKNMVETWSTRYISPHAS